MRPRSQIDGDIADAAASEGNRGATAHVQGSDLIPSVTLRDIAIVVFRRWRQMFLIFLGAIVAVLGYVLVLQDPAYESEARLLIRLGQESAPPPTMLLDRQVVVTRSPSDVTTELDILRSRELATAVITRLNLPAFFVKPDPPEGLLRRIKYEIKELVSNIREFIDEMLIAIGLQERISLNDRLVMVLTGALNVTVQPNSNVMVVSLRWPWRDGPSTLLTEMIAAYQELRQRAGSGASSVRFFEESRAEARARLIASDADLSRFESENGIQLLEEQKSLIVRTLSETETRLSQAQADRKLAELRLASLKDARRREVVSFGTFEVGGAGQMMALDLAKLRAERDSLSARESSGSARLIRLQIEIESLFDSLVAHLETALREKQDAYELAVARRDSLSAELERLHRTEIGWRLLRREAKSAEDSYQLYDRKLEEARAVAALDAARIANVAVLQPPTEPTGPLPQRRGLLVGLAAVLGLLAGISWIGLLEFLDHRIHTVDDLARRITVPVLGVMPLSRNIRRYR